MKAYRFELCGMNFYFDSPEKALVELTAVISGSSSYHIELGEDSYLESQKLGVEGDDCFDAFINEDKGIFIFDKKHGERIGQLHSINIQ